MVDPLVVKRKLQKMLEYLNELESMRDITLEDYVKDFRNKGIVERLIQSFAGGTGVGNRPVRG